MKTNTISVISVRIRSVFIPSPRWPPHTHTALDCVSVPAGHCAPPFAASRAARAGPSVGRTHFHCWLAATAPAARVNLHARTRCATQPRDRGRLLPRPFARPAQDPQWGPPDLGSEGSDLMPGGHRRPTLLRRNSNSNEEEEGRRGKGRWRLPRRAFLGAAAGCRHR
jgi:hypothetical protein